VRAKKKKSWGAMRGGLGQLTVSSKGAPETAVQPLKALFRYYRSGNLGIRFRLLCSELKGSKQVVPPWRYLSLAICWSSPSASIRLGTGPSKNSGMSDPH
jgi:hypothetical protein